MLGVGPMNYQGTPKVKKPKAHARGATIPGPSTPGSIQAPLTPGSSSTGFGGFTNAQVQQFPQTPQLPSTPSLQTTGSFDSSNFHTVLSDASTGTKKSGGFFRLFKKDSRSDGTRSKEDLPSRGKTLYGRSEELTVEPESFDPVEEMGTLPPPDYIRPIPGQKLIPRREPNALSRTTSSPLGGMTQIGRARARAAARLNESITEVSESEWQTTTDGDEEQSALANSSSFYNETSNSFNDIIDLEEQHQFIVLASAPDGDDSAIAEWTNYIRCYSGGSFNISNPPAPPPRRMDFTYLPAMYPHDEATRITKHYSIDVPWPAELSAKLLALMDAAAKRFRINSASLSIFDERFEKFRIDVGYNIGDIERTTSIAAHALYSEEVLVILDTHQDWRFAGNPWVTGSPYTRFFAGAPLISDAGGIIGVFAIFSKQPRSEFLRGDRRELAEFAALMAKDMCLHGEHMSDPDLRHSVVRSKRDTRTNLVPHPLHFQKQLSPLVTQPAFFPMEFNFQKHSSPLTKQSQFFTDGQSEDVFVNSPETSMSMSHDSSARDSDILYMAAPPRSRGFSAESVFPNHNSPEAFHQYLTPTQPQGSDNRPYSASDLTSVDMPQNNTPNDSYYSGRNSDYYQFDLDGPATPKQPRFVFPNSIYRSLGPSTSGISLNNSFGRLYMEGDSMLGNSFHQELLEPEVTTPSTSLTRAFSTMSSTSIGTSFSSRIGGPNNDDDAENPSGNAPSNVAQSVAAEANFSCSFSGKRYGFDQVYAAKVDCPYPGMSDQELLGPNGLTLKILASYGLPYDYESELNQETYLKEAFLKALRTNEFCYTWNQEEGPRLHEQGALGFGVLMPLSPLAIALSPDKDQSRSRDHGIVYAMFNRATFDSNKNLQPPVMDLHGYMCAAQAMTILLFNLEIPKDDETLLSATKSRAPRGRTPTIIGATEVGQIYYSRRSTSGYSRNSSF
ncbi:hypothetical protein SBOR_5273 [Sclerotinia borealis F-4128]|uniref:GAF domain-containing protein n=1 Tax=Sclerotinia borealis (strain F-4128) TaxID=1432307 RepID=W9CI38_SCLBF|nr:hypothetical protein SBOR_5273 [Sclerotinia borealis F-4128]